MGENLSNTCLMGFFLRNNQPESQLHYGMVKLMVGWGKAEVWCGSKTPVFPCK